MLWLSNMLNQSHWPNRLLLPRAKRHSRRTRCGPQPLQRISASWYRPVHQLGLCALPMLRCSSFLAYTPNWPVALFLLLLHPPGTLYLLTFDCAKIFSLSNAFENPSIQTHLVLLCCIKHHCIFGPKGAIQIHYYYYYYKSKAHMWLPINLPL